MRVNDYCESDDDQDYNHINGECTKSGWRDVGDRVVGAWSAFHAKGGGCRGNMFPSLKHDNHVKVYSVCFMAASSYCYR